MNKIIYLLTITFGLTSPILFSQVKIGDNDQTINTNSLLELESTDKGLLLPRVALVASDNASPLTSHVTGMTVYNTATAGSGTTSVSPGLYYNTGSGWERVYGSSNSEGTYGEMHNTTEVNLAGNTGDQKIVFNTAGPSKNVTIDLANESFTVLNDGAYSISISTSYTFDQNGIGLKIKVNNVTRANLGQGGFFYYSQNLSGEYIDNTSLQTILNLSQNDVVTFYAYRNGTGGGNEPMSSAHASIMRISGGASGTPGVDGVDGTDGNTILNGTVDPTTEGNDGDFYYNTATTTIFGPKASGVWPSGIQLNNTVPVASVIASAASSTPAGYLYCDGSSVSTTTYADLFAAIGYTYGGTGGTFQLPDYRGQFLRGQDDGRGVDLDAGSRTGGDAVGSTQGYATALPTSAFTGSTSTDGSHTHTTSLLKTATASGNIASGNIAFGDNENVTINNWTDANGDHNHTVTINGGGDNETRPTNIAVRYYIKF